MRVPDNSAPVRGTRPHNRRRLIIQAAAELFSERGFRHVSMADIAGAVAVGPSALYRHFAGKQEILGEVLVARMQSFSAQVAGAVGDGGSFQTLAQAALDHRDFGVLWEREARYLDPETRRTLTRGIAGVVASLERIVRSEVEGLADEEARLRSWTVIGILVSPSFHHIGPMGGQLLTLLAEMAQAAVHVSSGTTSDRREAFDSGAGPSSRREQLLGAAIRLFAEHGYGGVGIENIAAEAGLTGTSVYRYFEAKDEILVAAMTRGAERLRLDLSRVLARTAEPDAGLRGLLATYIGFVVDDPALISVMLSETAHLPEGDRRRLVNAQRDYMAEWIHLVLKLHPSESADVARVRVQAALTIANTCARSPKLVATPGLVGRLEAAGAAALGL